MADNVVLNAGSGGATLATDDIAGVHYQIVKLAYGALDAATVVDGSNQLPTLATQAGTWNITNVSGTVSLPTGAATAAKQPALGTAGVASADVITIQGIASMTKLLVTPDSVALPANQSVNVSQVAGTATDTNSGNKSAGTLRVVLATDQPALTNKLLVTPDANSAVNVAQMNGVTVTMGVGASGTGVQRVAIATDGQGQLVDNAGFTDGTTRVDVAGFIFDDVAGTALTENDVAAARIDSKRALMVTLEDATTRAQKLAISAAGAAAANLAQIAATTTATGNGTASAGCQRVTVASDNTAFSVNATLKPGTSGGLSKFHLVSAATTNATNVKASAGQLFGWYIYNSNAAARKVAFHNTSGTPTAGTSVTDSFVIPPGGAANAFSDVGIAFSSGIAITTVTGLADSDSTAVAANDLVINLYYA